MKKATNFKDTGDTYQVKYRLLDDGEHAVVIEDGDLLIFQVIPKHDAIEALRCASLDRNNPDYFKPVGGYTMYADGDVVLNYAEDSVDDFIDQLNESEIV